MSRITFVMPVFREFVISRRCLASFFEHTPDGRAVVVDDGSPDWHEDWLEGFDCQRLQIKHFKHNAGLTPTWNAGFAMALSTHCDYLALGNSDLLFSPLWFVSLMAGMAGGYQFLGPLTNAPGASASKLQQVRHYMPDYRLTDHPGELARTAAYLLKTYGHQVAESPINGFFMFSTPDAWRSIRFKPGVLFPDPLPVMPSGRRNPQPHMQGQEDWLAVRCRDAGRWMGVALGSYIFHYRSVSRGMKYVTDGWYRERKMFIIYTAISWPVKDVLRPPLWSPRPDDPPVRFIAFTDDYFRHPVWEHRPPVWRHATDPCRTARFHKLQPHVLFAGERDLHYTLWLDGTHQLKANPRELVHDWLSVGRDFAVHAHSQRNCIYAELAACLRLHKDDPAVMRRQIERYRAEGYPAGCGLYETGVLLRRMTAVQAGQDDRWWQEVRNGSRRDQLSLPYVLWKLQRASTVQVLPGTVRQSPFFNFYPHR